MMENSPSSVAFELDIFAFIQDQRKRSGALSVMDLPRLAEEVVSGTVNQHLPIQYTVVGQYSEDAQGAPQLELLLDMTVVLWLECQRCLSPYEQTLPIHTRFRIVKTQAEAEEAPLDQDYDVIAGSTQFNLLDLLEEEILLALPLIAKHTDGHPQCKAHFDIDQSAFDVSKASKGNADTKNPFSILMNLKPKP